MGTYMSVTYIDFKGAILNQKKEKEKKKNIDDCKQLRNFFELSLS